MLLFVASITTLLYYWSFAFAHLFELPQIILPFWTASSCKNFLYRHYAQNPPSKPFFHRHFTVKNLCFLLKF